MKAQPVQEQWIQAAEAASFLSISERHLARRCKQGYIRKRTLPRQPHEKGPTVEYSVEDLTALKEGNPNRQLVVTMSSTEQISTATAPAVQKEKNGKLATFEGLAKFLAELTVNVRELNTTNAVKADTAKPWLTLEEAAEFSGLPRAYLRKEARRSLQLTLFPEPGRPQRPILVRNVGTDAREVFMFSRESLQG